jgi:hypothetical protein
MAHFPGFIRGDYSKAPRNPSSKESENALVPQPIPSHIGLAMTNGRAVAPPSDASATPKPRCTEQDSCPSGTGDDNAAVGRFMAYHRITMSNGT